MVGVTAVAIGDAHGLALRGDGKVVSWGEAYRTPPGLNDVVAIAAGSWHSLALRRDGTVVGWGESAAGQAEPPVGLSDVTAIAAGGHHSLALRRDGTIVAWGANSDGQVRVPFGLDRVVAIAAGAFHSLALLADGSVAAWGHPDSDQRHVPNLLGRAIAIAAGYENSSAILADGTVVDWGIDRQFQRVPEGFHDVVQIVYGRHERLALRRDGTIVAHTRSVRSEQLEGTRNVTSIAGSVTADHSSFLALNAEGEVVVIKHYLVGEAANRDSELYPALAVPPAGLLKAEGQASATQSAAPSTNRTVQLPEGPSGHLLVWVARGDGAQVRRLLDLGADINAVDAHGDGVLRYALDPRDLDVLKLLLERGADPNAASTSASGRPGFFILHAAAEIGWDEGIDLLIGHGALVDARGLGGITPMMLAAGAGHDSSVAALHARGANIDAVDSDGDSVLFYPASNGHHTTVKRLLALGADASPRPALSGHTPLTVAAGFAGPFGGRYRQAGVPASDFTKVVVALLRAGADAAPMYRAGYELSSDNRRVPLEQLPQRIHDQDYWNVSYVPQ